MGLGFADWLADRTGIHPTQIGHAVGNVLDNKWAKGAMAAGLGFTGVGAPLGAMLMGGAGALGGALHEGGGLRDAFTGGAEGAAMGGAAGGIGQSLRGGSMFAPGSSAAGGVTQAGSAMAPSASSIALPSGMVAPPIGATSGGSSFMNAARGVGSFIHDNPTAVGEGLKGVGSIASVNSANAANRAQADTAQYDLEQRRRRDASLEPLRRLLSGQMNGFMQNNHGVAPNPYAPQGAAPNPYGP